jgi:DsbC/DsbD-like thiol-disulfide interchange protein
MQLNVLNLSPQEPPVRVSARVEKGLARLDVVVRIELENGVYLYADPAPPGLEPLRVEVSAPLGVAGGEPHYPQPTSVNEDDATGYQQAVEIVVPLAKRPSGAKPSLEVQVSYQACTDTACFQPRMERLRIDLEDDS